MTSPVSSSPLPSAIAGRPAGGQVARLLQRPGQPEPFTRSAGAGPAPEARRPQGAGDGMYRSGREIQNWLTSSAPFVGQGDEPTPPVQSLEEMQNHANEVIERTRTTGGMAGVLGIRPPDARFTRY